MTYGNASNVHSAGAWWMSALFDTHWMRGWSRWSVVGRCTQCGRGHVLFAGKQGQTEAPVSGVSRWLCSFCGANWSESVHWIGRVTATGTAVEQWEWKLASELPPDLQPAAERDAFALAVAAEVEVALPARLDAEFEAHVAAAVEVERALVRAGQAS